MVVMIEFIAGELVELGPDYAVIDADGVGYRLWISSNTRFELSETPPGESVRLLTHLQWREEGPELYGFVDKAERELFRLLLGVNGIGPRLALQVLSGISPEGLRQAVLHGRSEELQRVRGIGKRIAERIVLELKDKLPPVGVEAPMPTTAEAELAYEALRALGFTATEAHRALERAQAQAGSEGLSTEELIKRALELARAR